MSSTPTMADSREKQNPRAPCAHRHRVINGLSKLLTGLRAFESDLLSVATSQSEVIGIVEEYIPMLVATVHEVSLLVKDDGEEPPGEP
jgi:hypothetical protein